MKSPVMYFSYFSSMTFGFSIHTMKETVTLHKDPNMEAFVPQGYFTCLQASVNGFGFCWHNFSALGPQRIFHPMHLMEIFSVYAKCPFVQFEDWKISRYLDGRGFLQIGKTKGTWFPNKRHSLDKLSIDKIRKLLPKSKCFQVNSFQKT